MLIQKAIAVESKAGLQPSYVIRDIDLHCLRGNQPAYNTTTEVRTQGTSIKDFKIENPQPNPHELKIQAPQHSSNTETSEKAWREKMKKDRRNRRDWQLQDQERSTLATGVNLTDSTRKNRDN